MELKCSNPECKFSQSAAKDTPAYNTLSKIEKCPYCQSPVAWSNPMTDLFKDGVSLFILVKGETLSITYRLGDKVLVAEAAIEMAASQTLLSVMKTVERLSE